MGQVCGKWRMDLLPASSRMGRVYASGEGTGVVDSPCMGHCSHSERMIRHIVGLHCGLVIS